MMDILYLVHRIPYPPNKGDKIRAYHLLRCLAAEFRVHLGCFIDDPNDLQFKDELERYCASVHAERLRPQWARIKSIPGVLGGRPCSIRYFDSRKMRRWVEDTVSENNVTSVVAYSSPMAQFVTGGRFQNMRRLMDFVDVDSDKWSQYSEKSGIPLKWLYKREAASLSTFECRIASEFDASTFVTENEVRLFGQIAPNSSESHFAVGNGVDTAYFRSDHEFEAPFHDDARPIVFTGMMDYRPNIDSMSWFAREIFPAIRARCGHAELWVVGASPTNEVRDLAKIEGVFVTGRVADVRPYLSHASLVVAPLRMARGIQNKVLEALAMEKIVLCTDQASAGLKNSGDLPIIRCNSADQFIDESLKVLQTPDEGTKRPENRRYVLSNYDWDMNLRWIVDWCAQRQ